MPREATRALPTQVKPRGSTDFETLTSLYRQIFGFLQHASQGQGGLPGAKKDSSKKERREHGMLTLPLLLRAPAPALDADLGAAAAPSMPHSRRE